MGNSGPSVWRISYNYLNTIMRTHAHWPLVLVLGTSLLIVSCTQPEAQLPTPMPDSLPENTADQSLPPRHFLMAVSSTPASFEPQDRIDAFIKAEAATDVLLLQDPFNYIDFVNEEIPNSLRMQDEQGKKSLVDATGLLVYYGMDTIKQRMALGTEVGDSSSDPSVRTAFRRGALYYLQLYQPQFMALGIEVNYYYIAEPEDFENYVSLYKETYDEIKKISPRTKVFVTFQYEALQGLQDGFSEHWDILDKFRDKLDYLAISTHPYYPKGEIFSSSADLPPDYFSKLQQKSVKPIIIAETSWSSFPEIDGSEEEQLEYLDIVIGNADRMDMPLIVWINLFDTDYEKLMEAAGLPASVGEGFSGIGMLSTSGVPKLVYSKWLATRGRTME